MMPQIGEFALWAALPVAVFGAVFGFMGGYRKRGDLVLGAERSIYASFGLLILASLGIIFAFLGDRFEYRYVANYSNRTLDTFYKVAGLWSGQDGSLVFWVLLLAFFSALTVFLNRQKNREFMPYVVGVLQTIIAFFVVVLLFADVNPFAKLDFLPADGRGLNPQLQNYWMTVHPPTLYLGFTAFSIPFAFAIASLLSGRLDSRWIVLTRKWTLVSWFFLTNGIIFGMRWAYVELGWGGYWFWDPVENASLLPWLTATAFLHSIQIQENRGMLKIWNMSLVTLTFLLTLFATFLTRSGLIDSVHTFAENTRIAFIFLSFMGAAAALSALLIAWRAPQLKSERRLESFISRESAFLFNNLIFLGAAFAVMWGTMLPLITEGLTGDKMAVGPAFFNRVNIPIGLILLALVGIGPVIAWRRASAKNLKRNFVTPVAVGLGVGAILFALGMRQWMALLTFTISAFVLTVIVIEFWKGTKARARIEGEGFARAFVHLVSRNRRRWGGYIVHVGIVVVFAGFAGSSFNQELRVNASPGDVMTIQSPYGHTYDVTYETLSSGRNEGNILLRAVALFSVRKDGVDVGNLTAEKRSYVAWPNLATEVGIRSTPFEDLYIILGELEDPEGFLLSGEASADNATVSVLVKPLVGWIWYGGLIMTIGTLVALWPSVGSVAASPKSAEGRDESAAVPVG